MNGTETKDWLNGVKSKVKTRTYIRYEEIMQTHILPFLEGRHICSVTPADWEGFAASLSQSGNKQTGKGLSDNSVIQIMGVVKRLYRYLVKTGCAEKSPVENLSVRMRQKQIEVLSEYEQKKLEKDIFKRRSLREYGVIISLYTGLRIGELLALTWDDVDLRQRRIRVEKTLSPIKVSTNENPFIGTPKTYSGERVVPIPRALLPVFCELKGQKRHYVISSRFGNYVQVSSYQKTFAKLIERLKIRHIGFHSLRHTFATRAVERGADMKTLSEILGHSSPSITMSRYVHSSDKQKYRLMEKVGSTLKSAE